MGGGETYVSPHCFSQEEQLVESQRFDHYTQKSDKSTLNTRATPSVNEGFGKKFRDSRRWDSVDSSQSAIADFRRLKEFEEIMQSYANLKLRLPTLEQAKSKILSYRPGAWTEEVGYLKMNDYDVPKTTTFLLVGLSGSGKSSLVNKISTVFEDDKFASDRAQVSYNAAGDGTFFLHEYMIPRGSSSFCLYDTRGLCENPHDNFEIIKSWMTKGVQHGQLILRDTDLSREKNIMKCKARQAFSSKKLRTVNFVIFVINAHSVLKGMNGEEDMEHHNYLLKEYFNHPYLSCKDDKPAVVCTHGDLLSLVDRARVRIHLGELLGVPPAKQIFDIPDHCDPETDLAVVDLLRYSLLCADKNYPVKKSHYKVWGVLMIFLVFVCFFATAAMKSGSLDSVMKFQATVALDRCQGLKNNSLDGATNFQATAAMDLSQGLENSSLDSAMNFQATAATELDQGLESSSLDSATDLQATAAMELDQGLENSSLGSATNFQATAASDLGQEVENSRLESATIFQETAASDSQSYHGHLHQFQQAGRAQNLDQELDIDWRKIRHLW